MAGNITGPDGRPLAPTLHTVAPIRHCGDCHHAVLMAQADGSLDIDVLTCLEAPPQICHIPHFRHGPAIAAPHMPGGRMPGPPQFVGMQELAKYPNVGRRMRACHRFTERTDQDKAAETIDVANAKSDQPLEQQAKN